VILKTDMEICSAQSVGFSIAYAEFVKSAKALYLMMMKTLIVKHAGRNKPSAHNVRIQEAPSKMQMVTGFVRSA